VNHSFFSNPNCYSSEGNLTCGTTTGIQREDSLDGDVHSGGVEGLEHDLGHLLTVSLGVERRLGEEDGVLLGSHTELVVEGVMPDLLHVIPVADDTVLDGVLEGQDTPLGLGFVADVGVLLTHPDHDTGVARAPHDTGEDGPRGVISSEPSLRTQHILLMSTIRQLPRAVEIADRISWLTLTIPVPLSQTRGWMSSASAIFYLQQSSHDDTCVKFK
jgi:hypothetical protein